MSSALLHWSFLLTLPPSWFAVCGHHPFARITTVFSLLSSVPNFTSHSSIISQHIPVLLVHFTFSHYVSSTYSISLPKGNICASPSSRLLVYCIYFFLAGPGPLPEIAVSSFSRSPLGRADMLPFLSQTSFSACSLLYIAISTLTIFLFVLSGYTPRSVLTILQYSSYLSLSI